MRLEVETGGVGSRSAISGKMCPMNDSRSNRSPV